MPNMDGTGPTGQGPLSGRGAGRCNKRSSTGRCVRLSTQKDSKQVLDEKEQVLLAELDRVRTMKQALDGEE